MKKIFSWILLCIVATVVVHAQKLSIPAAVLEAFKAKFPEAKKVKWGRENAKEYEAEFLLNNSKTSANFESGGKWIETESKILITELPKVVSGAIVAQYKNCVITEAYRIEKPGGETVYEADIKMANKKKEVLLKEDGTFIK